MAIEFTYDQQLKIIMTRVHGYLCIEDLNNFMSEVLSSEDIPSDANTLWDITEMEFDNIDIQLQEKIIAMRKKYDTQRGNAKIAIVSNYALGDIIVKLFLELAKDISLNVNAFKTREQAMLWFKQA